MTMGGTVGQLRRPLAERPLSDSSVALRQASADVHPVHRRLRVRLAAKDVDDLRAGQLYRSRSPPEEGSAPGLASGPPSSLASASATGSARYLWMSPAAIPTEEEWSRLWQTSLP